MRLIDRLAPYRKAVAATVAPVVPLVIAGTLDGSPGGSTLTTAELIVIGVTMLASGGATYAAPRNAEPPGAG